MSKVLITGATGFVGACLAEDLVKEGHEIYITTRANSNLWRLNKIKNHIRIFNVDLCDEYKVHNMVKEVRPEVIFHLATYGAYYYQQETDKIINANVNGTVNLVNACEMIDYNAFVNIGSSSEYGKKINSMKETDVLEPISTYGVTKATATMYCQMIAKTKNKPIGTVRFFSVYGYYEDKTRLIPSVAVPILKGERPKLATGSAVRDFIFVDDVIDLVKKVAFEGSIAGKIYNAGTGEQHSIQEMANALIKGSESTITPEWGAISGRSFDTDRWEADMSFVKKELNWEPKYDLKSGAKKTIEWYKENLNLYLY